ncbi:MAG: AAA family ATPase [Candidatus Kapabacteria bacterium]|nr:AAA family ATPase [Candidatus Kapabacteria bacterium]
MKLTSEQIEIINSQGNIKINAVAGSGKTTTIIEYAKARPKSSKILYLAFNRSVRLEAERKFLKQGLNNVKVETAHSLAYKNIVYKHNYSVCSGYKTHEIVEILHLGGLPEKHAEYVVANHINKFISYFCNSDKQRVDELNYLKTVFEVQAKSFVTKYYDYIIEKSRVLLNKMRTGEINVIHDFYLKKYQLSNPILNYDYILFDEGQDASPAMLDVFLKQNATKIIVGDTYQQIYGWRHAVNSLEKTEFATLNLSTSFRFGQEIASLAKEVLGWKKHLEEYKGTEIIGLGKNKVNKSKAVLGRTNLGLLLRAIDFVTEKGKNKPIYFEGNISSYTYAEDGTSLYDVLDLFNGKRKSIRDKLIASMKDIEELKEYIEQTEDQQLGMMLEIVKEYGNEIPGIIKKIKDNHVGDNEKDKAEFIFSTVHRCKGMEYDEVHIVDDFLSEKGIIDILKNNDGEEINLSKLNEEINLLYVALTRTKTKIYLPERLVSEDFPDSPNIILIVKESKDEKAEPEIKSIAKIKPVPKRITTKVKPGTEKIKEQIEKGISKKIQNDEKAYSVEKIRVKHSAAYQAWTKQQDRELRAMSENGMKIPELAKHFGRTKGAIWARMRLLEIE